MTLEMTLASAMQKNVLKIQIGGVILSSGKKISRWRTLAGVFGYYSLQT